MKRGDITDEQVLAIIDSGNGRVIDALTAQGVPAKVAFRKLQHMDQRGLIDYGTSLHHVWRRTPAVDPFAGLQSALQEAMRPLAETLLAGMMRWQRWYDTRRGT